MLDDESSFLDVFFCPLWKWVWKVTGLDGHTLETVEILAREEGMVAHPIEDVIECGDVECAESEMGIGAYGFEQEEGKPVGEGDIAIVSEGCFAHLGEFLKELSELLMLATGFEDGHGS